MARPNKVQENTKAGLHWFYIKWMEKKGKKALTVESIGAMIDETNEAYYLAGSVDITNGAIINGIPILKSKVILMHEMVIKNGPSKYLVINQDSNKAINNVGVFEAQCPESALAIAKKEWPNSDDLHAKDFRLCLNNWTWFDSIPFALPDCICGVNPSDQELATCPRCRKK